MLSSTGGVVGLQKKKDNKREVKQRKCAEAVKLGQVEEFKYLLTDVDVNEPQKKGRTLLHMACVAGRTEIVKVLLSKQGIDVNLQDADGNTALHLGAKFGHKDTVAALLNSPFRCLTIMNEEFQAPIDVAKSEDIKELLSMYLQSEHVPSTFLPEKVPKARGLGPVQKPSKRDPSETYTQSQQQRKDRNLAQNPQRPKEELAKKSSFCAIL